MDEEEIVHMINLESEPPPYGYLMWDYDDFHGSTFISWIGEPLPREFVHSVHHPIRTSGLIDNGVEIRLEESAWTFFEINELPAQNSNVSFAIQFVALWGFTQEILALNPDAALVLQKIEIDGLSHSTPGEPPEEEPGPLAGIIGPEVAVGGDNEIGRHPFPMESTEPGESGWHDEYTIELAPWVVNEILAQGAPTSLGVSWRIYPQARDLILPAGSVEGEFLGGMSTVIRMYHGELPIQPNVAPRLIMKFELEPEFEQVIHVRHVAKRRREQYRRPSHTLRLRGPA